MHIDRDDRLTGAIACSGTVHIDGMLEGDIACGRLEIGAGGRVIGTVAADELVIAGELIGNARARRIWLRASALVEGDLWHAALVVDPHAVLIGDLHRDARAGAPEPVRCLQAQQAATDAELDDIAKASRTRDSLSCGVRMAWPMARRRER